MCCVPQAFQGPIKMEKLEYTVERCAQYVRVSGAETFVEDLAAFVPRQRARDVAKKPQSGTGVGAGMCVEKNKMPGAGAPSRQQRPAARRRLRRASLLCAMVGAPLPQAEDAEAPPPRKTSWCPWSLPECADGDDSVICAGDAGSDAGDSGDEAVLRLAADLSDLRGLEHHLRQANAERRAEVAERGWLRIKKRRLERGRVVAPPPPASSSSGPPPPAAPVGPPPAPLGHDGAPPDDEDDHVAQRRRITPSGARQGAEMIGLNGESFRILRAQGGLAESGLSIWCTRHGPGCRRDIHHRKSGLSDEEAMARLIRWRDDGVHYSSREEHKFDSRRGTKKRSRGGDLLVEYASPG